MPDVAVPYGKLHTFRQWLGIGEAELKRLEDLKDVFLPRKEEFARFFSDFFMNIPEARLIIEHERKQGHLLQAWAAWFEALFSSGLSEDFLQYLWNVGKRHVEIRLDKRFSNTGFSVVRQFCQRVILSDLPAGQEAGAMQVVDKLIDFCLLVETDAYLETTTRCDVEIIRGIADRIRNPVTVIGGNINRLLRHADPQDPAFPVYKFISLQSRKCERMVRDIRTYIEVFEREPLFERIGLEELLKEVLDSLLAQGRFPAPRLEISIPPGATHILADRNDMKALFRHLLENSLEALEEKDPLLAISSSLEGARAHSLVVTIFNAGAPIREEDIEKLYSPFFSTKPEGTGFGLPIARQAVRNNMGGLKFEVVPGEGTRAVLSLAVAEED